MRIETHNKMRNTEIKNIDIDRIIEKSKKRWRKY